MNPLKLLKQHLFTGAVFYCIFILFLFGCSQEKKKTINQNWVKIKLSEAKKFNIFTQPYITKLIVTNPWQGASNIDYEYFLSSTKNLITDVNIRKKTILIPIKKVVCLSTTHIAFIEELGFTNTIKGFTGTNYIFSPVIKNKIQSKEIINLGYDNNLNYEKILKLKPDVVFVYGVGPETQKIILRLNDIGIPAVVIGEYLEENILAKAEWIKFFSCFFNTLNLAEKKYFQIKNEYDLLKNSVSNCFEKPHVMTGLPWKGTWWIPGGKSNIANLITDAGGKYLWNENQSKESFMTSYENVFLHSAKADYWINCGTANNKKEIIQVDERLKKIKLLSTNKIFNNNARVSNAGGNDYWESGVVKPQLILKDLITILHPEKIKNKKLYYYKAIE